MCTHDRARKTIANLLIAEDLITGVTVQRKYEEKLQRMICSGLLLSVQFSNSPNNGTFQFEKYNLLELKVWH